MSPVTGEKSWGGQWGDNCNSVSLVSRHFSETGGGGWGGGGNKGWNLKAVASVGEHWANAASSLAHYLTLRDSSKDDAWYFACSLIVVCERELRQAHTCRPFGSRLWSGGCCL